MVDPATSSSNNIPVSGSDRAHATHDQFELFHSILDSMGDGIVVADEQGRFLLFNPAAESILGIGRTDLPPEKWAETYGVFFPDTHTPFPYEQMPLLRAIRGEECNQVEVFIRNQARPDGVFISVTGRPLRDASGNNCGGVVVFRDITSKKRIEENLVYKRNLLQALMDHIPDPIFFKDRESHFTRVNCALAARFGLYHPQEAFGKSDADFFSDEHAGQALADERQIMQTGKPIINKEEKETWPDGHVSWASTTKMPLLDEKGKIVGTFGISRDITERKKAEEQLLKLSQALEQTADAVFIMDRNGTIEYVNPAFSKISGYTREEALGQGPRLLRSELERESTEKELWQLLQEGQTQREVRTNQRKDGEVFFADETITPLRDSTGYITHFVVTCKDITASLKHVEELRKSRERFMLAVEGSKDGLWDWDLETNEVYYSPRWKAMLGWEDHELANRFEEWADRLHPDDRGRAMSVLHAYLQNQLSDYEIELRLRHKDGSYRWILSRGVAFRDDKGRPYRMAGSHTDVTERRKAEEALKKARADAEAANRAKNQFLANVSHEIRTPMNGILGMTELALATDLTHEQGEFLQMVKVSANALLVVINDVLDFSKIEAGKLDIEANVFSLHDLLGDTVKSMALRAHGKGLELACRIADGVPDWVVGDEARLRQILVNLIGNAIKFTEEGEVVVSVENEASNPECGVQKAECEDTPPSTLCALRLTVKDTGIGIPGDKQKAVFDPFIQADGSMSRKYGGTGLGLSISARLIELMGGKIWLESKLGQGSTFSFTLSLPLADSAGPWSRAASATSLRGLRVLIVDDNTTNRLILTEMARGWGMEPTAAEDGLTALMLLKEAAASGAPFPLVLLDAMMPGMDGFALAAEIQRHPELARATIMMLTSADRGGDGARCRSLGIASSLTKPFKASELFNSIVKVLGPGSLEQAARGPSTPPTGKEASPAQDGDMQPVVPSMKVLVAEDNAINQALVRSLLHKQGHKVVLVANGREAVDVYQQQSFDVVLMDVQMPVLDGFEATRLIREHQKGTGKRTPIYAMTAHAMKGDRERCLEMGMDGYLAKPISAAELWKTLSRLADCTQNLGAGGGVG
jgi:PAS domain S-box-containing protein